MLNGLRLPAQGQAAVINRVVESEYVSVTTRSLKLARPRDNAQEPDAN